MVRCGKARLGGSPTKRLAVVEKEQHHDGRQQQRDAHTQHHARVAQCPLVAKQRKHDEALHRAQAIGAVLQDVALGVRLAAARPRLERVGKDGLWWEACGAR